MLLTESQLNNLVKNVVVETRKRIDEQRLIEDIILSENIIDKVKDLSKKGLLTAAIVTSLMSSQNVSSADKAAIKQISNTQVTQKDTQNQDSIETEKTYVKQIAGNGFGVGVDSTPEAAKKKAISLARNNSAERIGEYMGDVDYSVTDMKIGKEKTYQNDNGQYVCEIELTMKVNFN